MSGSNKNDMLIKKVLKTTTLDRIEQQKRIDVADFDYYVEDLWMTLEDQGYC